MPLTEEQRQSIRDEELYRHEVQKEFASRKGPPTLLERVSTFFESKAGFWVLTTVLAGVTATGLTWLQRYMDREEIARREKAEHTRQDMETVLKLGPMLTSEKRTQVDVAIVLLDGLASDDAIDSRVANQVKALVQSTLNSGLNKNATAEEKMQAETILAFTDRERVSSIQTTQSDTPPALPAVPSAISTAIDNSALPARIYLQIASTDNQSKAEATRAALRNVGIIVPGIEQVTPRIMPKENDLRYCEGKVDANSLERVKSAVAGNVKPPPKIVVLDPRLCGKVRFNHFELWYARDNS